ncbi:MAG: hypothetical protein GYA59_11225, partial [Chloroflexi bacterium]|nr:hypothetical protein [Chloroflexota bacterium]
MSHIIILPDWLIANTQETPLRQWGVRVVDSEIAEIAPNETLRERYAGDATVE